MIRAFTINRARLGLLAGATFAWLPGAAIAAPPEPDGATGSSEGGPPVDESASNESARGGESTERAPSNAAPPSPTEGAGEAARATGVKMPEFVEGPSPTYPEVEGARDAKSVGLRLSLDTNGAVTAAEVIESAGAAFDEEALRVAKAYRFTPAMRDGVAVAVRIAVRVELTPPAETQPVPAAAAAVPAASGGGEAAGAPPKKKITPAEDEVHVLGEQHEADKLRQSADAVTVIDLEDEKQRSSDMGEVLARTPGIVIRRAGGVGSDVRISLNGLYDRSVREFVDSVPLWMTAFPENVSALPVNLFERVEVYRGVVPLRLAADALGGAINFVTDRSYENHLAASLQAGSFGTARGTMLAQYRHEPTNFVARVVAYADDVKNDYFVDVEVPDERGRLSDATVPLFHNVYSAWGVAAEAGYVDKPWTKRFLVRGSGSSSNKELQHNLVMTVPYGEPWYGDVSGSAAVIYDQDFGAREQVHLETTTNYSHRATDFVDLGEYVYDWFGAQVRDRRVPGEISATPIDQTLWRNAVFHRTMLEWEVTPEHVLLGSATPLFSSQYGEDRTATDPSRDPLAMENSLVNFVGGLGYEWNAIPMPGAPKDALARRRGTDFRLQNTFNVKTYFYHLDSSEPLPGGGFREQNSETVNYGIGDGVRFSLTEWLFLKGSYEYARRLPDPYEIFGDGVLVTPNLSLNPEVSHNVNFGPLLDVRGTEVGDVVAMANLAYRDSDDMIVLLGSDRYFTYQNVYRAVTWSGEAGLSWTSPLEFVTFDGSATYNDSRNRSDDGPFQAYAGDPIPNRSPFGTSWALRFTIKRVFQPGDRLEPFYQGRFTEGFFRGWQSQGITQYKQRVDDQVAQDLGITYMNQWPHARLTSTFEVQNFTNEKLFDDYGVQRPGRAFYVKLTAQVF